ncbi:MAG: hypothetical protein HY695_15785 [Deltaproteobacteria bacterium]|nr:hypothetical protein [Deltaproteobacteria bacterium]
MLRLRSLSVIFVFLLGCDPVPVQRPPDLVSSPTALPDGTVPSHSAGGLPTPVDPQISGAQRWQYAWTKAMEGVAMGGSIGGPYGAGGGLLIGLVTGLLTAESHYRQINAQVQAEHSKDKALEAQIEQELERQRELEAQLGKTAGPVDVKPREEPRPAQSAKARSGDTAGEKKEDPTTVASLGKKEKTPAPQSSPFKNVEIKDTNQDGVPDLWIYYHPSKPREIIRQEEDTNGDGRVDTWSTFRDGKLLRREVDTKGSGRPDTHYYYDDDRIAREERDENGDGLVSFRAIYQKGRLARVEKDLDRDGRTDLWIYYDPSKDQDLVLREERDLNGDGTVDVWSYYDGGRLARRDVSAVGWEILSGQGEIPSSGGEYRKVSSSGG